MARALNPADAFVRNRYPGQAPVDFSVQTPHVQTCLSRGREKKREQGSCPRGLRTCRCMPLSAHVYLHVCTRTYRNIHVRLYIYVRVSGCATKIAGLFPPASPAHANQKEGFQKSERSSRRGRRLFSLLLREEKILTVRRTSPSCYGGIHAREDSHPGTKEDRPYSSLEKQIAVDRETDRGRKTRGKRERKRGEGKEEECSGLQLVMAIGGGLSSGHPRREFRLPFAGRALFRSCGVLGLVRQDRLGLFSALNAKLQRAIYYERLDEETRQKLSTKPPPFVLSSSSSPSALSSPSTSTSTHVSGRERNRPDYLRLLLSTWFLRRRFL